MSASSVPIVVVTCNPSDFPGKHVVRRHWIQDDCVRVEDEPLAVTDSLEEARAAIPEGLVRIGRHPEDDPVIVESWL